MIASTGGRAIARRKVRKIAQEKEIGLTTAALQRPQQRETVMNDKEVEEPAMEIGLSKVVWVNFGRSLAGAYCHDPVCACPIHARRRLPDVWAEAAPLEPLDPQ